MNKSLTPLIIVVAVVVALTLIIINYDVGMGKRPLDFQKARTPKVELRKFRNENDFVFHTVKTRKEDTIVMKVDKRLAAAQRFLASGDSAKAEDELRTLLVFHPNNMKALTLLGGILFYSRRYAEAELIFRRQINISPKNHKAYNRLGSVLAKQKKFKEAINNASTAVGINPQSGEAQINLAGMYAAIGNKAAALEHLRKAVQLLGQAVLPLTEDHIFDTLRDIPEFHKIISNTINNEEIPSISTFRVKNSKDNEKKNLSNPAKR